MGYYYRCMIYKSICLSESLITHFLLKNILCEFHNTHPQTQNIHLQSKTGFKWLVLKISDKLDSDFVCWNQLIRIQDYNKTPTQHTNHFFKLK